MTGHHDIKPKRNGVSGKKRIKFSFYAPDAEKVSLAGSFNNWDAGKSLMKKDSDGRWHIVKMLPKGSHEYRFMVDDTWVNDPDNPVTVGNEYGSYNNVKVIE